MNATAGYLRLHRDGSPYPEIPTQAIRQINQKPFSRKPIRRELHGTTGEGQAIENKKESGTSGKEAFETGQAPLRLHSQRTRLNSEDARAVFFEYHRTPRHDDQIVIAADFTSDSGEYAVKRYEAHPKFWRFLSDNPAYAPVIIKKTEMRFPILGIFVACVKSEDAKIMS